VVSDVVVVVVAAGVVADAAGVVGVVFGFSAALAVARGWRSTF